MSNLKQSFDQVRAALSGLDTALADALNAQTNAHLAELLDLTSSYQTKLAEQKEKYETLLAAAKEDLRDIEERAEEALDLGGEVKAQRAGVLPTTSLPARLLFEKLADRWECLTNAEIRAIESILEGRALVV
jgi:hypothetical protein